MKIGPSKKAARSRAGLIAGAAALGAAALALWIESKARRAARDNPPTGQFLEVDGVHLHYVDRGEGPAVVLLHGNMVSLKDFEACGLIDRLAQTRRVVAFDRPGFGHSSRPRDRLWTPAAQAKLLSAAFRLLDIDRPVVLGHSMGAMVAVELGLNHSQDIDGLVLLGGYFYPSLRVDALLTAPVALPVVGDVMRYTVTPVAGRLGIKSAVKAMFMPRDIPDDFFPILSREMMLRPIQLRANAEDAAFMIPAARASQLRHHELQMPVVIVAGADDRVVDPEAHSVRLHHDLVQGSLAVIPAIGHMVHYGAIDELVAMIDGQFALAPAVPLVAEAEASLP